MNEIIIDIARIILLLEPKVSFYDFAQQLKDISGAAPEDAKNVFTRFRGFDGREMPTHCFYCGQELTNHGGNPCN